MLEVNGRKYKVIKDEYIVVNDNYIPLPLDDKITAFAPMQEAKAVLAMTTCHEAVKVIKKENVTALIDAYTVALIDDSGENVYITSQKEFSDYIPKGGEVYVQLGSVRVNTLCVFELKANLDILGGNK